MILLRIARSYQKFVYHLDSICHLSIHNMNISKGSLVTLHEMKEFITRCMTAVGTCETHAQALADVVAAADYRGHFSHGLNRLEMYVNDIKEGICIGEGVPEIVKESAATAYVDGKNLLGPVVGNFCMDLAINKAKDTGIGWVVAKGSNHFGIAAWYSMQASDQGFLGMSFTNTSPLMAPTRAKKAALGTNPLSLAAPATNGDDFVLDMATTSVALGKIEIQQRKQEPIPEGWALDNQGKVTTDPKEVFMGGTLLPLGGTENTSGYKGYGLAMMVEILCGILGGASYGPNIRSWLKVDRPANLGQCFIAINPECFEPGFKERMADLMISCRNQEPADEAPVLVAGDPEKKHMSKCDAEGGIRYHINQIAFAEELAKKLGVKPLKTLS